uniref:Secreted protein n=1 Tax=Anopheles dirus TaxID=7168 RepID=A0A182NXJ1_9DIPT
MESGQQCGGVLLAALSLCKAECVVIQSNSSVYEAVRRRVDFNTTHVGCKSKSQLFGDDAQHTHTHRDETGGAFFGLGGLGCINKHVFGFNLRLYQQTLPRPKHVHYITNN